MVITMSMQNIFKFKCNLEKYHLNIFSDFKDKKTRSIVLDPRLYMTWNCHSSCPIKGFGSIYNVKTLELVVIEVNT